MMEFITEHFIRFEVIHGGIRMDLGVALLVLLSCLSISKFRQFVGRYRKA